MSRHCSRSYRSACLVPATICYAYEDMGTKGASTAWTTHSKRSRSCPFGGAGPAAAGSRADRAAARGGRPRATAVQVPRGLDFKRRCSARLRRGGAGGAAGGTAPVSRRRNTTTAATTAPQPTLGL